jgi:hypothetical protein
MAVTIKTLIDKNKSAYDGKFFIESLSLSYILINKALKQIVKDEFEIELIDQKIKTVDLVGQLKKELAVHPTLKSKVSKKLVKDISLFLDLYKLLHKELKFQFPEKKIQDAATLGINCIVILNTSLVKIKNNKVA